MRRRCRCQFNLLAGDADVCNCNTEGFVNSEIYCYPNSNSYQLKSRVLARYDETKHQITDSDDVDNLLQAQYLPTGDKDVDGLVPHKEEEGVVTCDPSEFGGSGCCDTYPDSHTNLLSHTCGSNMQGSNRFERGLLYMLYLSNLWQEFNYTPSVEIVHGMGHNRDAFYRSKTFQRLAYIGDEES